MRYIPTDKYTVAWFKLAECVAKGEKEKAFGVYRLLMHSLEDKAYAHQLEGDLLGAFQDERALEKYEYAAHLYKSNNRWKEAIALYEELVLMTADNFKPLNCLVELYKKYKQPEQYGTKIITLMQNLIAKKQFTSIEYLIDTLPEPALSSESVNLYTACCLNSIKKNEIEPRITQKLMKKILNFLSLPESKTALVQFLTTLEHTDKEWHTFAHTYITSK